MGRDDEALLEERRRAARAWRDGHVAAQARALEEDRARSIRERVEQTAMLMRTAHRLGWQTTDPDEVERVRARFTRLQALRGVQVRTAQR